jgi:hypothetical protein
MFRKKRIKQQSQTLGRKKLQMKSRGEEVSKLEDFLEACDKRDMSLLINVS